MVNNVMFLPWKLTSQRTNLKYFLLIGFVTVSILIILLYSDDSCGISHISLTNKISSYEQSLDPEFCEEIVEQIDSFNDICEPQIEILDCG